MRVPFVTVVICTRNREDTLSRFAMRSLQGLDYPNYEVLVVDDASADGTAEVVKANPAGVKNLRYLRNDVPRGLSYARNLGIAGAKGELIAFIDDDVTVERQWLRELVEPYRFDPSVMCVGGLSFVGRTGEVFGHPEVVLGCNMSFRREVFDHYEFDTALYFNGCSWFDETELINRLAADGLKVVCRPCALARHFRTDAACRDRAAAGGPLNYMYMMAKKMKAGEYYLRLAQALFGVLEMEEAFPCSPESRNWGFIEAARLFRGEHEVELSVRERLLLLWRAAVEIPAAATRRRSVRRGSKQDRSSQAVDGGTRSLR